MWTPQVCLLCPRKAKEGIGSPRTGMMDSYEPACVCWVKPRLSGRAAVFLRISPALHGLYMLVINSELQIMHRCHIRGRNKKALPLESFNQDGVWIWILYFLLLSSSVLSFCCCCLKAFLWICPCLCLLSVCVWWLCMCVELCVSGCLPLTKDLTL